MEGKLAGLLTLDIFEEILEDIMERVTLIFSYSILIFSFNLLSSSAKFWTQIELFEAKSFILTLLAFIPSISMLFEMILLPYLRIFECRS